MIPNALVCMCSMLTDSTESLCVSLAYAFDNYLNTDRRTSMNLIDVVEAVPSSTK